MFGSMVQKGKFSAGTVSLVRVLKRVLLPTLGRPTIPTWAAQNQVQVALFEKCSYHPSPVMVIRTFRWDLKRPRIGFSLGSSTFFLGAML